MRYLNILFASMHNCLLYPGACAVNQFVGVVVNMNTTIKASVYLSSLDFIHMLYHKINK